MKNILLTWDSYNHGFIVTLNAVYLLFSEKDIKIDEIYYLQDKTLQKGSLSEIRIFENYKNYKEEIKIFNKADKNDNFIIEHIEETYKICKKLDFKPKLIQKNINIKNVVDYQSIYDELRKFIRDTFFALKDTELHINCSPGTPQMHVVWLMLNSSGYLPTNTTLWSSQFKKETNTTSLEKIKFKPQTYLNETFDSSYERKYPQINPNETKSDKRKDVEQKLQIFMSIPNAPILLLGERGTGKSTYVRNFKNFYNSNKNIKFHELACGTFSEELMRSELFGHKKGSFTGAILDKKGFFDDFENDGILFLDEIHDLSKPLQRQLMQVLQTGEYFPIGSNEKKTAKFKLICASNLPLNELINHKKLDLDFFDRISSFIVEIPALRECKADFENFWKEVWKEVANFDNAPKFIWNKDISNCLDNSNLDGNFRDLQRLVRLLVAYTIENKNEKTALKKAIEEIKKFEKIRAEITTETKKSYFIENKTYEEIISYFNRDLAFWAEEKYGDKKTASEILKRSESQLVKDKSLYRLKN